MKEKDFHTSFKITASPKEVFKGITKVGDWWLTSFKGKAAKANDTFSLIMGDHGHVNVKIIEAIPDKKIVWLVTDSTLTHYTDEKEWNNTKMIFEISEDKGKTKVDFTHLGLVPKMECYGDCVWGWNNYVTKSLPKLIKDGEGMPYDGPYEDKKIINNQKNMKKQDDFTYNLNVKATSTETIKRISEVGQWWAKDFKGKAAKVDDKFSVYFGDTYVDFKISEIIPGKKVVWLVTDCNLHWIDDKKEWKNTKVIWNISEKDGKTKIEFVHKGMTPESECFESCEEGWKHHIKDSLVKLIEKGKGFPE